nr:sugar carrier protein A [Ipomoea batatas]
MGEEKMGKSRGVMATAAALGGSVVGRRRAGEDRHNKVWTSKGLIEEPPRVLLLQHSGAVLRFAGPPRVRSTQQVSGNLLIVVCGAFVGSDKVGKARAEQYQGRVTCYVLVACMVAAGDGSLFGYFGYSPL